MGKVHMLLYRTYEVTSHSTKASDEHPAGQSQHGVNSLVYML